MKKGFLTWCAATGLALFAGVASAQSLPRFDLERLSIDPSARGSLVIGNGETLKLYEVRLSLGAHWEHQPLVVSEDALVLGRGVGADSDVALKVVEDRVTMHLGAAATVLSFADDTARVELSARVPVVAWQQGDDLPGGVSLETSALGRPWLGVRFGFIPKELGLTAAIAADVQIPTGQDDAFANETRATIVPRVEIGKRFNGWLLAAQAGGILRPDKIALAENSIGDEFTAGLAVATTGRPLRGELSVRGATTFSPSDETRRSLEVLAGVRYAIGQGEVFALGGPGFFEAPGTPTYRAIVGLAWDFARPEAVAAAVAPAPVDPCAAGQAHTPEQCPALDDDGDGIANGQDACPLVAGIAELKGCPPKDTDGDGVSDHLDACPDVAGIAELKGCPSKDTDGDGIADHLDKCPDVAGVEEQQGCPKAKAVLTAEKIELKEAVYFDTGKATIKPVSFEMLDDVAAILNRNPQVTGILIEGHTDSSGAHDMNVKLSQARAESVKAYLVAKGVDAGRLEAQGFGPDRPIADNKTKAGREQNRRVEFSVKGLAK